MSGLAQRDDNGDRIPSDARDCPDAVWGDDSILMPKCTSPKAIK
jgi:hypothetical protein